MNKKSKVIHVTASCIYGGTEQVIMDLLKSCDRQKFEFSVINIMKCEKLKKFIEEAGVPFMEFDKPVSKLSLSLVKKLHNLFISQKPDAVHCHLDGGDFYGGMASFMARVPKRIYTLHDFEKKYYSSEKNYWLHYCFRWSSYHFFFTDIIAISHGIKKVFENTYHLKNIRVIYNGIALDRIKPVNGSEKPDTAVNLGISSRIDRIKGHFELLEAFRKFEDPNVRLLIANKGPDLEELKQKVYGYGLDDRVKFTGFFDKIGDFLKQLDIFVQPSRKEPFGLTALEALAAGIPVVASNLIGLDEVVEDNKTGLLFKMMDAHDLHEKLALLVKNPELRQKMGIAARESVKKFDVMNQVRGYESLYTESEETC